MPIRGHMLKVGPYVFSMHTAAYDNFARKDSWRWQAVETIGSEVQYQYRGPGERAITLKGVVFTHYAPGDTPFAPARPVGMGQVNSLRSVADMAVPLQVTDGRGNSFGRWIITDLGTSNSIFFDNGAERKQEFDLTMKYYSHGGFGFSISFGIGISFGGIIGGGAVSQVVAGSASLGVTIGASVSVGASVSTGISGAGIADASNAHLSAGFSANATIGG